MREILGWIDMFLVNLLGLGLVLLVITVVLAIIVFVLEMIFGEAKISKKASADILAIPYNHNRNATDEAQHRFISEHIRAHEDGIRLHDMAAREAWDAHTTACDQHQAAVDMHNDFSFGGCDPWF